ncbi:unannotated protein [freshwater metagenome]|uniref:Unannotated protein n=1 Tax=freshwater metagenome TaxID=449393 RepID=A0A6J7EYQ5_9ZZZZ
MAEAVGEHRRAEPNLVGGDGESSERRDRPDLITEMIGNHEAVVTQFLGLLSQLDELPSPALLRVSLSACSEAEFARPGGRGLGGTHLLLSSGVWSGRHLGSEVVGTGGLGTPCGQSAGADPRRSKASL